MILKTIKGLPHLHKAAATEQGRYAMHHIQATKLDDGRMRCAATDGRKLACVALDASEEDVEGFISTEAWQAALKSESKDAPPALAANGTIAVRNKANTATTHFDRPKEGEFPRYEAVIPKGYEDPKNPDFVRFSFNPEYLLAVAAAIGQDPDSPCVTVHIQTETYREMVPVVDEKGEPVFEQVPVRYPGSTKQAIDLDGKPKFEQGKQLMRAGNEVKFRQVKNAPLVVTNGDRDAVGVIMPISID